MYPPWAHGTQGSPAAHGLHGVIGCLMGPWNPRGPWAHRTPWASDYVIVLDVFHFRLIVYIFETRFAGHVVCFSVAFYNAVLICLTPGFGPPCFSHSGRLALCRCLKSGLRCIGVSAYLWLFMALSAYRRIGVCLEYVARRHIGGVCLVACRHFRNIGVLASAWL